MAFLATHKLPDLNLIRCFRCLLQTLRLPSMPSIGAPVNQMTALSQLLQANPSAFAALVAASAGGNLRPSAPSLPAAGSGIYPPPPFASVGRGRGVVSHPPPPPPLLPGGGGRGRGRGRGGGGRGGGGPQPDLIVIEASAGASEASKATWTTNCVHVLVDSYIDLRKSLAIETQDDNRAAMKRDAVKSQELLAAMVQKGVTQFTEAQIDAKKKNLGQTFKAVTDLERQLSGWNHNLWTLLKAYENKADAGHVAANSRMQGVSNFVPKTCRHWYSESIHRKLEEVEGQRPANDTSGDIDGVDAVAGDILAALDNEGIDEIGDDDGAAGDNLLSPLPTSRSLQKNTPQTQQQPRPRQSKQGVPSSATLLEGEGVPVKVENQGGKKRALENSSGHMKLLAGLDKILEKNNETGSNIAASMAKMSDYEAEKSKMMAGTIDRDSAIAAWAKQATISGKLDEKGKLLQYLRDLKATFDAGAMDEDDYNSEKMQTMAKIKSL